MKQVCFSGKFFLLPHIIYNTIYKLPDRLQTAMQPLGRAIQVMHLCKCSHVQAIKVKFHVFKAMYVKRTLVIMLVSMQHWKTLIFQENLFWPAPTLPQTLRVVQLHLLATELIHCRNPA